MHEAEKVVRGRLWSYCLISDNLLLLFIHLVCLGHVDELA